jgi:hypothetical protein
MDDHTVGNTAEEGDIAVVRTKSGRRYVGIYTLAPGIDYFWNPVISGTAPSALNDPDVAWVVIGKTSNSD